MRIKKTTETTPRTSETLNVESNSTKDAYSCDYSNKRNTYSTDEVFTGKYWIDGKKIYRKYITFQHTKAGNYIYTHNLGIDCVISCDALCTVANQTVSSNGYRPMPYIVSESNYLRIGSIKENTIETTAGEWTNNTIYLTLEYTKTTN